MEFCMEARALKSSVRGELTMQKTQVVGLDDLPLFYMNNFNGAVSGEDFSVDCFFDFNNGEFEEGSVEEDEEKKFVSISSEGLATDDDSNSNSSSLSFDSLVSNELSVPDDEIAGLEWVSHFVDDSLPVIPLSTPAFKQQSENHENARFEAEPEPVFVKTPCFSAPVPSKARSKRTKPANRTWSVGSMPLSESLSSTTTSSCASSDVTVSSTNVQSTELVNDFAEPPTKKQKKKPAVQAVFSSGNPFQRRCSHCQVQKTPQWRTGPLGAKTLCNACGVRYKSGRLYPEYRPACSPTFSSEIHSNSHRKVLEMRKKKEGEGQEESESSLMVPSF